jgi:hypothetical protein
MISLPPLLIKQETVNNNFKHNLVFSQPVNIDASPNFGENDPTENKPNKSMRNNETPKPAIGPDQKTPGQESDFVVKAKTKEGSQKDERLNLLELEKEDIKNNLADFNEDDRRIMEKYVNGEEMTAGEKNQIFMIKSEWWKKERNCYDDTERQQYLKEKFSGKNPFEQNEKTAKMQSDLLKAFKINDPAAIARLHQEYIARFPEQIEGVEALMGLNDYFENDKKIPASRIARKKHRDEMQRIAKDIGVYPADSDEKFELALEYNRMFDQMKKMKKGYRDLIQDQAAYQTLIGDFVKNNVNNEEFLKKFWELNSEIGAAKGNYKDAERLRAGVLSQVAIIHTLQSLGWNPRIVHPEEDAFKKTDLKLEIEERGPINLQIKGTPKESQVIGGKAEVVNEMRIEKRSKCRTEQPYT